MNRNDLASIDILRIMTRVSRRVALDYESFNPDKTWLHKQKQIPTIHTTLIRDLFFKPNKRRHPPEPVVFEGSMVCFMYFFIIMQITFIYLFNIF